MKMKDITMITSRGSFTLFFLAFVIAFIAGCLSMVLDSDPSTVITLTAIGGVLTTMVITKVASLLGMQFAVSNNPGNLGTIIALLLILMLL